MDQAGIVTIIDEAIERFASRDLIGSSEVVDFLLDLRSAVASLEPRDRELVALRYGADLSARQIAEVLELKTNAVEVALHRALRRLREKLTAPATDRPSPAVDWQPDDSPSRV